jgi:serine/threonine protein phosphatase PrpC
VGQGQQLHLKSALRLRRNARLETQHGKSDATNSLQEDAHISNVEFGEQQSLFAVFDGHGGREVAKYAEIHFEDCVKSSPAFSRLDYKTALRQGFMDIDVRLNNGGLQELAEMKRKNPPAKSPLMKVINESMGKGGAGAEAEGDEGLMLDGIGCTANVILLDWAKKKLYVANAGDSRCVMGHGGKCTALSFDHKPECQTEIDRIYKAGSVITEGRVDGNLNLTRALGDLRHKQKDLPAEEQPITANPDVYEYDLPADLDFILMGCDGVWEQKSNEEMVEWIYRRCDNKMANTDLTEVVSDLLKKECLSPDHT